MKTLVALCPGPLRSPTGFKRCLRTHTASGISRGDGRTKRPGRVAGAGGVLARFLQEPLHAAGQALRFPRPGAVPRPAAVPPSLVGGNLAVAMSSGASVSALQRLVEQLKLEAGVERIKVSQAAAELQQYCMQNACKDALLVGVPAGSNPFREPRSCALL